MRGNSGAKEPRFSLTAFTLPGRVTTSVLFRVPATGRDRTASLVYFRPPWYIAWMTPGASLRKRNTARASSRGGQGGGGGGFAGRLGGFNIFFRANLVC